MTLRSRILGSSNGETTTDESNSFAGASKAIVRTRLTSQNNLTRQCLRLLAALAALDFGLWVSKARLFARCALVSVYDDDDDCDCLGGRSARFGIKSDDIVTCVIVSHL